MRYYYIVTEFLENGDEICISRIETESPNLNQTYQESTKEESEMAFGKKKVNGQWIEIEKETE